MTDEMGIHMAGFKDIIGQEQIKQHLSQALLQGRISHAYIMKGFRARNLSRTSSLQRCNAKTVTDMNHVESATPVNRLSR